jgi:ectoine hydroxylase-related dioxygenase (phytanoyl-CoA dioxygenase family)
MSTFTIDQHGLSFVPQALDAPAIQQLIAVIGPVSGAGRRGILSVQAVRELADSRLMLDLVRPHLPQEPMAVRAIYFNKTPDANWLVTWHQDLTIAVNERVEIPGFGPWSIKDGVPHVQPPTECLEKMIAVRIHLDDTDANNGALKVLPETHTLGRVSAEQIQDFRSKNNEYLCEASAGDILLMRPLLLHASSRSGDNRSRRVLHIEYAGFELPGGLHWGE